MINQELDFPWDGDYTDYAMRELLSPHAEQTLDRTVEFLALRNHRGLVAAGGVMDFYGVPPAELWLCFCKPFVLDLRQNFRELISAFADLKIKYGRIEAHVEENFEQGNRLMRFCRWTPIVSVRSHSGMMLIKYENLK